MPEKIPINKLLSSVNQVAKNLYAYSSTPTGASVRNHNKPLMHLVHAVRKSKQTYMAQKRFAKTPQKRFQRNIKFITAFLVDSFKMDINHPILVENSKVHAPQTGFGIFEYCPEMIIHNQLTTQDYTALAALQEHLKSFYSALEEYLQNNQSEENNLTHMVDQWIKDEVGTRDEIAQRLAQINRPLPDILQPEAIEKMDTTALNIVLPLFSMFSIYCAYQFNIAPPAAVMKCLLAPFVYTLPVISLGATTRVLFPDLIPSCTRHIVSHLRSPYPTYAAIDMNQIENEDRINYRR
jgi:hypothetical protein